MIQKETITGLSANCKLSGRYPRRCVVAGDFGLNAAYRFVQGNKTVGHAYIDPPAGASDYALTTTGPSGEVFNPITMVPTGGLDTQFIPDSSGPGDYMITFRLNNGNTERQFIHVDRLAAAEVLLV